VRPNDKPFKVNISQEVIDDLRQRLSNTRWPDEIKGADWSYGTNLGYLKSLVRYWREDFDWRAQEERINRFAHFQTDIDGAGLHSSNKRSGVEFVRPPKQEPYGIVAVFKDLYGNLWDLLQPEEW
jgi:hypothetical protein